MRHGNDVISVNTTKNSKCFHNPISLYRFNFSKQTVNTPVENNRDGVTNVLTNLGFIFSQDIFTKTARPNIKLHLRKANILRSVQWLCCCANVV